MLGEGGKETTTNVGGARLSAQNSTILGCVVTHFNLVVASVIEFFMIEACSTWIKKTIVFKV